MNSKHFELTDTDFVNCNFTVEESVWVLTDVSATLCYHNNPNCTRILKFHKACRQGLKRYMARSMVLKNQTDEV